MLYGFTGVHWFTVLRQEGRWSDWQETGFDSSHEVGELHITASDRELYFHSSRLGEKGGFDIWVSSKADGQQSKPQNAEAAAYHTLMDGLSCRKMALSYGITRGNGAPELWRSRRVDGLWTKHTGMFGRFAGKASLDREDNAYFTHHVCKDDM